MINLYQMIEKTIFLLSYKDRMRYSFILLFSILNTVLELLSIGLFFSLLVNFVKSENELVKQFLTRFEKYIPEVYDLPVEFLLSIVILIIVIIKVVIGYYFVKKMASFSMNICRKTGVKLYTSIFSKNILELKNMNSDRILLDTIYGAERYSIIFVYGSMTIISNIILLTLFLAILITFNAKLSLISIFLCAIMGYFFNSVYFKRSRIISEIEESVTPALNKTVIESNQGFLDIKLNNIGLIQEKK